MTPKKTLLVIVGVLLPLFVFCGLSSQTKEIGPRKIRSGANYSVWDLGGGKYRLDARPWPAVHPALKAFRPGLLWADENPYYPDTLASRGVINGHGGTWPPVFDNVSIGDTGLYARKSSTGGFYWNELVALDFDTSALPVGSSISSATMTLAFFWINNDDTRNFVGEWYPSSNFPITGAMYTNADLSNSPTKAWNDIPIANINTGGGYTGMRIGISGGAPVGQNVVGFQSADSSTSPTLSATLTIIYGPAPPTTTPPPSPPVLSSPGNGSSGISTSASLGWNASTNTTSYGVYLGTSNPPGFVSNTPGV